MSNLSVKGYARKMDDSPAGRAWQRKLLNQELLRGHDLTNPIVGVLTRFRQGEVTIRADIESMYYHQVRVPEYQ